MTATGAQAEPRSATIDDLDGVVAALTASFHDDPMMVWAYPDPTIRPRRLDALWRFLAGLIYLPGGASTTLPDHTAAALWRAPGDDRADAVWEEHGERFAVEIEGDLERLGALAAQFDEYRPDVDHWYLLAIGVEPAAQGRGLGGRLLAHTLEEIDQHGGMAHLEATSRRSRVLYERFGFEVVSELSVDDSPPVWPMWRPAR